MVAHIAICHIKEELLSPQKSLLLLRNHKGVAVAKYGTVLRVAMSFAIPATVAAASGAHPVAGRGFQGGMVVRTPLLGLQNNQF